MSVSRKKKQKTWPCRLWGRKHRIAGRKGEGCPCVVLEQRPRGTPPTQMRGFPWQKQMCIRFLWLRDFRPKTAPLPKVYWASSNSLTDPVDCPALLLPMPRVPVPQLTQEKTVQKGPYKRLKRPPSPKFMSATFNPN